MTMHHLLDDLATTAPSADAGSAAARSWQAARQRRNRRRLAGLLSVVAVLVLDTVIAGAVRPTSHGSLPADQPLQPGQGIPSTIHDVQPWLATIGTSPVPPVVYAYVTADSLRPIAVSVDGSYRYLPDDPDPPNGYELSSFAISPDGEHLAMAWSQPVGLSASPAAHASLYVYDLATGDRRGPWLGQGLGGRIEDLTWRWDDHGLAWTEFRPDEPGGTGGQTATVVFDWEAGMRKDLTGVSGPVSWTPDGTKVVAAGEAAYEIVPVSGGSPVALPIDTRASLPVWSPDGRQVAAIRPCDGKSTFPGGLAACLIHRTGEGVVPGGVVNVIDVASGSVVTRPLDSFNGDASVLGWRANSPVVGGGAAGPREPTGEWLEPYVVLQDPGASTPTQVTGSGAPRYLSAVTAAQQLLATAPVVDRPPPSQPRFSSVWWTWTWEVHRTAVVFWCLVGLALMIGAGWWLRRRTHRHDVSLRLNRP